MKKILFISLIISIFSFNSLAGNEFQKKGDDWKQKMMNEKIAFLTAQMEMTPEEGQAFWPVYNQVAKEQDEAMREVHRNHKELKKAIEEGRSTKEVRKILESYLAAQEKLRMVDNGSADRFMKVLPVEKVAKLYLAEEKFRRQQIHKLHENKK